MSGYTPYLNQQVWDDPAESIFCETFIASSEDDNSAQNTNYSPNQSSSDSNSPAFVQSDSSSPVALSTHINPHSLLLQTQHHTQNTLDYAEQQSVHTQSFYSPLGNTSPSLGLTCHQTPQHITPPTHSLFCLPSGGLSAPKPETPSHSSPFGSAAPYVSHSRTPSSGIDKKEDRKMRNRLSAQKSRQKKEDALLECKIKVEYLERCNANLQKENDQLRAENMYLKEELRSARGGFAKVDSLRQGGVVFETQPQSHAMPPAVPNHSTQETLPTSASMAPRMPSYSIASLMMGLNRGALLMIVLSVGVMVTLVTSPYGPTVDPSQMTGLNLDRNLQGFRSRQILTIDKSAIPAYIDGVRLPGPSAEGQPSDLSCEAPVSAEGCVDEFPAAPIDETNQNSRPQDALHDSLGLRQKNGWVKEDDAGEDADVEDNADIDDGVNVIGDGPETAQHEVIRHKQNLYNHRRISLHASDD